MQGMELWEKAIGVEEERLVWKNSAKMIVIVSGGGCGL